MFLTLGCQFWGAIMARFLDISGPHGGRIFGRFWCAAVCCRSRSVGPRYYLKRICDTSGSPGSIYGCEPCQHFWHAWSIWLSFCGFAGFVLRYWIWCISGFRFQMAISTGPTRGNHGWRFTARMQVVMVDWRVAMAQIILVMIWVVLPPVGEEYCCIPKNLL